MPFDSGEGVPERELEAAVGAVELVGVLSTRAAGELDAAGTDCEELWKR